MKKIVVGLILLIWLVPLFQYIHPVMELKKLEGSFTYSPDDSLTKSKWFNGTYTLNKEKYLNEQFGFRNFFVRSRNSIFFSLFRMPTANGVIIGKDNFLYEEKYINSYIGKDFIGKAAMRMKLEKLKFVIDTLKKLNVDLILAFAPGKATYYPEYIPDSYFINCDTINTNYKWATKIATQLGIKYLDYNALFKYKKLTTKFPLFPKTGIHWSLYASHYAFDTMITYIESIKHKRLPHFRYNKVTWSYDMKHPDEDIALALNTLVPPKPFKMPYPTVEYYDTVNKYRPKVITVADSYWGGIYYSYLPQHVFSKPEYWYFYSQNLDYGPDAIDPLTYNLKTKIENSDVIILMFTESHIGNLGWGFIEDAYALYTKKDYSQKDRQFATGRSKIKGWILTDPSWFFRVNLNAKRLHITLDSMMTLEADSLINKFNMFDVPAPVATADEVVINVLKNTPAFLNRIQLNAKKEHVADDLMIKTEANRILNSAEKVILIAPNNKYICADGAKNNIIIADRDTPGAWENFSLLRFSEDDKVALLSYKNLFVCAEMKQARELTASRPGMGAWETFQIIKLDNDLIAIKASNNKYLRLDEKTLRLFADSDSVGEMEKFKLKK